MGTARFAVWGILIIIFQASHLVTVEESTCVPGFESDVLIFRVTRTLLRQGTRLGKVRFTDCTDHTRFLFNSEDSRFMVQTDGTLMVKRQVVLRDGHQDFFIHSWDSQGHRMTVPVSVVHDGHHQGDHKHHQHNITDANNNTEVPVLHFLKSGQGLKRMKRDWIIPDLHVAENDRGPYPVKIAGIRSNEDRVKKVYYSITGYGADQPPVGLFTMDRVTGNLYLTQPLDRERIARYTFQAHAVAEGAGIAEEPMDIVVNVIDQNDNRPVFTKDIFMGEVAEASPIGFEVINVVATDPDQPNTDNSDLRYSLISQDPQLPSDSMFAINPITGVIRVNAGGLNKERYPKYTLEVAAADMVGEGLMTRARVILKVLDSNDVSTQPSSPADDSNTNAPVFTPSYEVAVAENKVDALVMKMSVTDGDKAHSPAWNAKFKIVDGDPGGLFTVKTGPNKQEGIISTAKGLDFEKSSKHTLLVTVENEVPFVTPLTTATATVVVNVLDVNEAPIFYPVEQLVFKMENLPVNSEVVQYTAADPDTARQQNIMYRIISDPAGWLKVDEDTGVITLVRFLYRMSPFVKDDRYTALIVAYDDDEVPATGTGTLVIEIEDVMDIV